MPKPNFAAAINRELGHHATVVEKPLDAIRPNPANRGAAEADTLDVARLAESIAAHGLIDPITIDETGLIISGHRRYYAVQRLNWRTVTCRILTGDTDLKAVIANTERLDLHPLQEAYEYRRLMESRNLTQAALAKLIGGASAGHVSERIQLTELPEDVQSRWLSHREDMSISEALQRLGKRKSPAEKPERKATPKQVVSAAKRLTDLIDSADPSGWSPENVAAVGEALSDGHRAIAHLMKQMGNVS